MINFLVTALLAAQVAVPTPAVSTPSPLQLTCLGGGTANKVSAHTAFSNGYASGMVGNLTSNASGSGTTTVYGTRQQGFGGERPCM